jgi:hypothetical protein
MTALLSSNRFLRAMAMVQASLRLGVVFDIDGLADPLYGYAAYQILFKTVIASDRSLLEGTRLWDGDTRATLAGTSRDYVIAVETGNAAALRRIRELMSGLDHPALKPVSRRFLADEALRTEPLVVAARINELGAMDWCDTSFVRNAWQAASKAVDAASGLSTDGTARDAWEQRKPA